MLAFWATSKHDLTDFYYTVFNSKLNLINIVRLLVSPGADSRTLPQMAQYNFSTVVLYNVSQEFVLAVLVLAATIFVRLEYVFY